ncbi:cytochrome P450 6B5-like [Anticarsia gemmatalis]|uniref:cytochrome P450 6B5-like n=1 Tax=Anticarsia gemmatalis TaxID=129554 RepID=UPI003F76F415
MFVTLICTVFIFILSFIYFRGKYNQYYWKKRGVAFYNKHITGGPYWQYVVEDRPMFEILKDVYDEHKNDPAVGLGSFFDNTLFVKDPVNIQHISQLDFNSFYHRGTPINEDDILANNVLWLNGPKWKIIRQKMTPLFTTAKLKNMYYIVDKSAQDFVEFLKQNPDRLKGDAFDTLTHFCSAAISAAVFGIGTKSTFDSSIRKRIRVALMPTLSLNLKFAVGGVCDVLYHALGLKMFGDHEDFFVDTIKQVIKQREKDNVKRHDFVDLCVKLQKEGTMQDQDTGVKVEPTDEVLAAQAFFFFLAGVEPTAAAMFGTMLELGRNPEMLKRVHEEVDAVFEKYNGQLTYESIYEVEYLYKVFSEALRVHTPIGFLTRQCMANTTLPVGNIPIEKGVKILTPVFDLHHDAKYFPNPEVFDPDRFSREGEVSDLNYVPFGKGNRYCIGARYARVQIMSGLMHFLRNYSLNTYVGKGGVQYSKESNQVRIKNVKIEFIPRN